MLTNVISSFRLKKSTVLKLISWKHSFKRLTEEYEIAKKKKQALDNLFENGRISQTTRDSFDKDINAVIMEIEKQQKDLLTKMQAKSQELESQIKTLETLLANYEIQHVVGEIEEEAYQREITLLSTGLESAKRELDVIKEATNQLCPPVEEATVEPTLITEENVAEVVQNEPEETISDAPTEEVEVATEPCAQEPVMTMDEAVPEEPTIESANIIMEEATQVAEETIEVAEDQPQITEEMPQIVEDTPQEMDDSAEITEEIQQNTDENLESTENDIPEIVPEELTQNVEEIENQPKITEDTQPLLEETLQMIENEPQTLDETFQIIEESPEEVHPLEAPEEAQEETSEAATEEAQSDEEAAANAETDEDTENQDY